MISSETKPHRTERDIRARILYPALFLLSAFAGTLFFSVSTSPLTAEYGWDSAMFQTIGKYWAEGYVPYVSLFDHKGPIIFFINAVGYAISGRKGVFILQVLFLTASEYMAYLLLSRRFGGFASCLAALVMPVILAASWTEGNFTEEYILPLLMASYYLMYKWCGGIGRGEYEHSPRAAFVYGLTFAFALLTRVTNALGVCAGVAFISVLLMVKGSWRNLLGNAAGFILGAAAITVPFCIYFSAHGALGEMWYGTLLFNLDYSASSGMDLPYSIPNLHAALYVAMTLIRIVLPGWCLAGAALYALVFGKGSRLSSVFWLFIALANTLFIYTLNSYPHYRIVLIPFFYLALCELRGTQSSPSLRRAGNVLAVCMSVLLLYSCILMRRSENFPHTAKNEYYEDGYSEILALIPDDGRDSFIAFDCPRRLYLDTGLRPSFRFFTLQQWMSSNSPGFAAKLHDEFDESRIEWVLTIAPVYHQADDILAARYECVAETEHGIYRLYHLTSAGN